MTKAVSGIISCDGPTCHDEGCISYYGMLMPNLPYDEGRVSYHVMVIPPLAEMKAVSVILSCWCSHLPWWRLCQLLCHGHAPTCHDMTKAVSIIMSWRCPHLPWWRLCLLTCHGNAPTCHDEGCVIYHVMVMSPIAMEAVSVIMSRWCPHLPWWRLCQLSCHGDAPTCHDEGFVSHHVMSKSPLTMMEAVSAIMSGRSPHLSPMKAMSVIIS